MRRQLYTIKERRRLHNFKLSNIRLFLKLANLAHLCSRLALFIYSSFSIFSFPLVGVTHTMHVVDAPGPLPWPLLPSERPTECRLQQSRVSVIRTSVQTQSGHDPVEPRSNECTCAGQPGPLSASPSLKQANPDPLPLEVRYNNYAMCLE